MSVLVRPDASDPTHLLPHLVAVAVAETLRSEHSVRASLQWPNDVYLEERKLGGILCEGSYSGESPSAVVAGIGVNVAQSPASLPDEVRARAAFLPDSVSLDRLALSILCRLESWWRRRDGAAIVERWRELADGERGRRVRVHPSEGAPYEAETEGIQSDGALSVRLADGERRALYADEVEYLRAESLAEESYYGAIESHFVERRGGPLFITPAEWALIQRWEQDEVPLDVVRAGIDQVFDRPRTARRPPEADLLPPDGRRAPPAASRSDPGRTAGTGRGGGERRARAPARSRRSPLGALASHGRGTLTSGRRREVSFRDRIRAGSPGRGPARRGRARRGARGPGVHRAGGRRLARAVPGAHARRSLRLRPAERLSASPATRYRAATAQPVRPMTTRAPSPVVRIEKIVAGGDGLARHEGRVLFVPGTAPGERHRIEIVEQKKDYGRARTVSCLEPSPDRREPPCPFHAACGGCALMHLEPEAQLEAKRAVLEDSLTRLASGVFRESGPPPVRVVASPETGYRSRARFHVREASGRVRVGFHPRRASRVVDVDACLLASPRVNEVYARVRDALIERRELGRVVASVELQESLDGSGRVTGRSSSDPGMDGDDSTTRPGSDGSGVRGSTESRSSAPGGRRRAPPATVSRDTVWAATGTSRAAGASSRSTASSSSSSSTACSPSTTCPAPWTSTAGSACSPCRWPSAPRRLSASSRRAPPMTTPSATSGVRAPRGCASSRRRGPVRRRVRLRGLGPRRRRPPAGRASRADAAGARPLSRPRDPLRVLRPAGTGPRSLRAVRCGVRGHRAHAVRLLSEYSPLRDRGGAPARPT